MTDKVFYETDLGFSTFMGLKKFCDTEKSDYVVIGIPFDTGSTFRIGSRMASEVIRQQSILLENYNVDLGVNIKDTLEGADYGDIKIVPGYIYETYTRIENTLSKILKTSGIPISIGGDHSITLPQLRVLAKKYGKLALIQFDAHTDTVDSYLGQKYNHATTFRRAYEEGLVDIKHSVQLGIRSQISDSLDLGFEVITANEIMESGIEVIGERIKQRVKGKKAFLTFDIDFVDPAYAPGTGTIEVGGISSLNAIELLRKTKGINVVGYDLVEVLPMYDEGNITSCLAARLISEFICLISIQNKRRKY